MAHSLCISVGLLYYYLILLFFISLFQFASFQRQLNLYGFRRLSVSGANVRRQQQQQPSSNHHGAYYHAMFLRKRHDLCPAIQRATEKELREQKLAHNKGKSSTSAAAAEPNLYALPPMPALDPQDVLQAESVTNTLQRKAPKNNSSNNKAGNNFLSTEILPLATSSNPAKAVLGVPHQQNPMAAASSSAVFSPQDWLTGGGAPLHPTSLGGNFSNNNTTASSFANNASSNTAVNSAYDSLFLGDDLCQPQLLPQPPASNLMEDMSWLEPTPLPEKPLSVPSQQAPPQQDSSSKAMAKRSRSPSMANFLDDVDFSDNDDGDVAPPPNKMLASFDAQPLAPPPAVALCPPARHMPSSSMMNMHNRKTNIKMPRCFADITTYSRAALVTKANSPFTIVYVNPLMMKALDESRSSDPSYFCGKSMQAFCSSEVTQLMSAAYCAKTMQAVQGNVAVQLIGSTDVHQSQLYEATVGPFFMSQDRQQIGNTEYLVWNFERRGVEMV